MPNGERFSSEHDRKHSVENNIKSPGNRRDASPVRSMPERNKRPRTPPEDPRARPPSPDGNRRQPSSPDRNMGRQSMSPPRRLSSSERQGRAPRRERSPMVMRYPTPPDDRRPRPQRARTPLSPGKVYTDKQESTEENGVFIDKVTSIKFPNVLAALHVRVQGLLCLISICIYFSLESKNTGPDGHIANQISKGQG